MAQYNTEGIVIGGNKLGEADRILRILTREHGKLSAIAKGVRRGKSKFSGCLEPMMVNSFLLAEGRNMEIVCQAENIHSYPAVRSKYELITSAGHLLEVASKLTEEGLPDPETYDLLLAALDSLESGTPPELVELSFKCGLMRSHGIFPDLAGCNDCGKTRTKAIHFNSAEMSFLCDDCAAARGVVHPVSKAALNGIYKNGDGGDLDEALKLADEILSAFLQMRVGRASGRRNHG